MPNTSSKPFTPLRVRAYLQTPVVSDKHLPLDAIMYNQAVREVLGPKTISKPRESTVREGAKVVLPILKRNQNEPEWYYACSFAVWPDHTVHDKQDYAKRFRSHEAEKYVDFGNRRGRVDTTRGAQKNYFIKEYTRNAEYVEWYLRGNKDAVEKLLFFCTHIGKKSAQGCGSVMDWTVQETDRDWYKNNDQGRLMRAMPSHKGNFIYGIRPSYWNPKHQTNVLMPD